jgi:multisubunit Na+/H+ antiporter MnhB subunit
MGLWVRFADDIGNLCSGAKVNCTSAGDAKNASGALTGHITGIVDTLLLIAGAIAVLIIILAGIRYVTSTGDAARVKAAKDTLLYAIVGLAVAILAYAIVNFVSTHL